MNKTRNTCITLELVEVIAKLRKSDKTMSEIANLLQLSRRQIERIYGILKYPDKLKKAIKDKNGGITITAASVLMRAKRKYGNEFNLNEWIEIAKNESVNILEIMVQEEFCKS